MFLLLLVILTWVILVTIIFVFIAGSTRPIAITEVPDVTPETK